MIHPLFTKLKNNNTETDRVEDLVLTLVILQEKPLCLNLGFLLNWQNHLPFDWINMLNAQSSTIKFSFNSIFWSIASEFMFQEFCRGLGLQIKVYRPADFNGADWLYIFLSSQYLLK